MESRPQVSALRGRRDGDGARRPGSSSLRPALGSSPAKDSGEGPGPDPRAGLRKFEKLGRLCTSW